MPAAVSPAFVSTPPSRAVTAVAVMLSLAVHGGMALVWLRPSLSLPDPAGEPAAVAVDIVPAPPAAEAAAAPAEAAADKGAPNIIPQLDPGLPAERSSPADAVPARRALPTRSERDLVLSQVVRHWRPPPELKAFADAEFAVKVTVLADGTLAAPFSARAPFDPAVAIEGYDALDPQHPQRRASESFYRALRRAQPLRLPATLTAKAPFEVVLNFRVRDVR